MKLTFRTFNCGAGECLFLILQKEDSSFCIMVDCGYLKDEILTFITEELNKRIDLLIVTHIDNDHISGLVSLLDKLPDLQIGRILFNCYHRPIIEQPLVLSEKQAAALAELKQRLPSVNVTVDGKINAKEAISLSEKILKNESWAAAWACEEVIAGQEILLDGDYGKITMLSPLQEDLNALELQFKKEFWSKFFDKHSKQYKADEEIYEVLLRLWETTIIEERASKVTYTKPTKDSFLKAADTKVLPVSLPNRCSIAFVYEYNNHRFLLLGDADPGIVAASLKGKIEGEMPYLMDMIKVSHHGSSHSTTSELMKIADSMHYYFTGGNKEERPSLETLSRIITEPLNGQERRVLHFNRKNTVLKDLCAMPELEEFPCEMDLENKPYEVEI